MAKGVTIKLDAAAIEIFTDKTAAEVFAVVGFYAVAGAQRRAPVRTGKLRSSIRWRRYPGKNGGVGRLSAIWYDLFLERPAKQIHTPRRTLIDAISEDVPKVI